MKLNKTIIAIISGFLGGIFALSLFSFNNAEQTQKEKNNLVLYDYQQQDRVDLRAAAQLSVEAVVHVKTTQYGRGYDDLSLFDFFFGESHSYQRRSVPVQGSGSGVIISDDGYIVTNNHVIDNSDKIEVILHDNRSYEAKLVGTDPGTDLALLKIDANNLTTLTYGNSDSVNLGEWVLAVGNPFNLNSTVTAGIISAKARSLGINRSKLSIESFLQTDAAVNPGNSGGALVNAEGKLIGINTAISSRTGSYVGYSFAIPSNIVKKVVEDLKKYGKVQRAFMGISIREIDAQFARDMNIDKVRGVWVASVEQEGAADKAGIKAGDIILDIDNSDVNTIPQLHEQVGRHNPGDKISVKIERNGKERVYVLELRNRQGGTEILKTDKYGLLGADFESLSKREKYTYGINWGVKVKNLREGRLKKLGINEGFIILKINNIAIYDKNDIENAIRKTIDGGVFITGITRAGRLKYYAFSLQD